MSEVDDPTWRGRFPGFDVLDERRHWDETTTEVVIARTAPPGPARYFSADEHVTACALCGRLLATDTPEIEVAAIDGRLADGRGDGWHHEAMPRDGEAWRQSLAALDDEATTRFGRPFATCSVVEQTELIDEVRCTDDVTWHGLPSRWTWSLWTRYACTAFFSHPRSWSEMGFPGPAYPRGYKHATVAGRERFEVRDRGDGPGRGAPR